MLLLLAATLTTASYTYAQEPSDTRGNAAARARGKGQHLEPPEPNRLERALMDLESGRLFERLLNPAEGLYPKMGNITSGSGFSVGPGYRQPGMFGGHADFSTFAAASLKRYWMIDARLQLPRLANNRAGVEVTRGATTFRKRASSVSDPTRFARTKSSTAWPTPSSARPAPIARRRG